MTWQLISDQHFPESIILFKIDKCTSLVFLIMSITIHLHMWIIQISSSVFNVCLWLPFASDHLLVLPNRSHHINKQFNIPLAGSFLSILSLIFYILFPNQVHLSVNSKVSKCDVLCMFTFWTNVISL